MLQWRMALDALRFAGGGPVAVIDQIARQIDGSALFRSTFLRTLEALGHIEVLRDAHDLSPIEWEICSSLLLASENDLALVGFWTGALAHSVTEAIGGSLSEHLRDDAPPKVAITLPTDVHKFDPATLGEVTTRFHPGFEIARVLPPISAVIAALPRSEAIPSLGIEWFEPATATWVPVSHADGVGAYRTNGFKKRYFVRSEAHLSNRTTSFADVFTVKHASAMMLAGRPLLAYDSRSGELIVPLGALLPGLYERAIVIETQEPPIDRRGFSIYRGVSKRLARRIAFLLNT